ncbi:MAG: hypothetical protein PUE34_06730, partial [Clostridiaceae bacterium]|nr:hypothetical protein [Clostridiaceae bacterium]
MADYAVLADFVAVFVFDLGFKSLSLDVCRCCVDLVIDRCRHITHFRAVAQHYADVGIFLCL